MKSACGFWSGGPRWSVLELALAGLLLSSLLVFSSSAAHAQNAACALPYSLTGTSATKALDNRKPGCAYWVATYSGNAPMTIKTSQDAVTWVSTVLTVAQGAMPTTSGYGRIVLVGYAPYLQVAASGTSGQTVEGTLYGTVGLSAAVAAATSSDSAARWMYVADPVNPTDWTSLTGANAPTTRVDGSGYITLTNASGTNNLRGVCRTLPAGNFTVDMTAVSAPFNGDGIYSAQAFMILNSGTGANVLSYVDEGDSSRATWSATKCTGLDATLCTSLTGAFSARVMSSGKSVPFTMRIVATATDYTFYAVDPHGNAVKPRDGSAQPYLFQAIKTTDIAGEDKLCYTVWNITGGYSGEYTFLGYKQL